MKVLYIAPLSENKEHSSGYASAEDVISISGTYV